MVSAAGEEDLRGTDFHRPHTSA